MDQSYRQKEPFFWRKLWAFSGPGAWVEVGYMDPGNWVTSVTGGAIALHLLFGWSMIVFCFDNSI